MPSVIEHSDDKGKAWSIVMTCVMESCDDNGLEHCDDKGRGGLCWKVHGEL